MAFNMKRFGFIALAGSSLGSLALAAPASAQTGAQQYNIPAQKLSSALETFSRQSGKEILFDSSKTIGKRSSPVSGALSADAALRALLDGTGMTARAANNNTFVVESGGRTNSLDATGGTDHAIIVTAQKREQRLIDVPIPVTAVSTASLVDSNSSRVQDYYQRIPGLSLVTIGNGNEAIVAIRGITTGGVAVNPTVGIVIDEVPFGPSIVSSNVPDIDPSILSGIEVLRGPQGSLYGASSMGGLIKFVTVAPSTSGIRGTLQTGISSVDRSGDVGYSARGDVNLPLGETLALRASGFYRLDPGYVDNAATGEHDVNNIRAKGGHASLLWAPSSTFSVRLGALVQNTERAASDEIDLSLDDDRFLQNNLPFTGRYEQQAEVYSAVVKARLGSVDITSISAFNRSNMASKLDVTPLVGGLYAALSTQFFGTPSTALPYYTNSEAISQELRINLPISDGINWLIGGLIDHEKLAIGNQINAFNTDTGAAIGSIVENLTRQKYRNYALFSNLDVTLSDRFSVQVGGRLSTNRQETRTLRSGVLIQALLGVPSIDTGIVKSKESPFNFSIAPQWKIRPDLMAYARVASGYRPGGPNLNCGNPGVICTYGSDSTVNYEIGLKGDFLNRLITVDASVYRIDWKDIQTFVITPDGISGYNDNGNKARSQGVELSVAVRPSRATSISAWISYNDAVLTADFPAAANLAAFDGDRLPYSSRWSGSASVNQNFALSDQLDAFVGGSLSYVGRRFGTFQAVPARSIFPSYWQVDLTAGVKWDDWRVNAYITNLTNERGVLRSGVDSNLPSAITYIRPRSAGVGISRSF